MRFQRGSSEEFVNDKYAVQAMPTVETKGYASGQDTLIFGSYDLKVLTI